VNAGREGTSLGVDPDLLLRFFVAFARFEYALKAAGFFRARPVGRNRAAEYADAEPDWRRFTESIRSAFRSDACATLLSACHYLFENPPYREVVADGNLMWETRPLRNDQPEVDRAMCYLRWVRNNLFHGGKFSPAHGGPGRNAALIEHSLVILGACLALSPDVSREYDRAAL
jgi:hypothetical protein